MNVFRSITICGMMIFMLSGCATSRVLQRETIHQSNTISEIHQQQVLNNLAKFVRNPNALPDFAWPKEGSATITDHCEGGSSIGWDPTGFASATLSHLFSRDKQDAWTMEPINDPRKLDLMRCAYQRAVASCGVYGPSASCPDCESRMKEFYGADYGTSAITKASYSCIQPGCCSWFAFGPKARVPKHCCHVGHDCDTYVWILPCGEDEFTKLTLTILDFAMNDPAQSRQKVVELNYHINQDGTRGNINSWKETFSADVDDPLKTKVAATTPTFPAPKMFDERGMAIESASPAGPVMVVPQNPVYPQQRTYVPQPGILQLRQQLNALAPQ
jgi:hypothetical protein